MASAFRLSASILVLLSLACGGGGGGGSNGSSSASIGQNSAPAIASGVVRGMFDAALVGEIVEEGLAGPDAAPARSDAPVRPGEPPLVVTRAAFGPVEEGCAQDGTVTYSGDAVDPSAPDVGDQILSDFALCDEDNGLVFDGLFDYTVLSLTGNLFDASRDASLDTVLTDFVVEEGGLLSTADGDALLDIDTSMLPVEQYDMAGDRIDLGAVGLSTTLETYTTQLVIDGNEDPEDWTIAADGRVTSSGFSGGVDLETVEVLAGSGEDYPDSGELLITGAFDATIRLLVNDATTVDLELDLDGNGSPDALVQDVTWDELFGVGP